MIRALMLAIYFLINFNLKAGDLYDSDLVIEAQDTVKLQP